MLKSPHDRETMISNGMRQNRGRDKALMARDWMEANKEAFEFVKSYIKDHDKIQNQRDFFREKLMEHKLLSTTNPYAFNNVEWDGLARYLVLADPSLKKKVEMRDSEIDCWGLYPISYLDLGNTDD